MVGQDVGPRRRGVAARATAHVRDGTDGRRLVGRELDPPADQRQRLQRRLDARAQAVPGGGEPGHARAGVRERDGPVRRARQRQDDRPRRQLQLSDRGPVLRLRRHGRGQGGRAAGARRALPLLDLHLPGPRERPGRRTRRCAPRRPSARPTSGSARSAIFGVGDQITVGTGAAAETATVTAVGTTGADRHRRHAHARADASRTRAARPCNDHSGPDRPGDEGGRRPRRRHARDVRHRRHVEDPQGRPVHDDHGHDPQRRLRRHAPSATTRVPRSPAGTRPASTTASWAPAYAIGPHPQPLNPKRDTFSHLDPATASSSTRRSSRSRSSSSPTAAWSRTSAR